MRNRLWLVSVGAAVLFWLASIPLAAVAAPLRQEGTALQYGQTVTGHIDDTAYFQQYTFLGNAGDAVVITMDAVSGDLDPLLLLGDADLTLIAQDDDGGGGFNARLEIVLPVDGTYIIQATRYGQDGDQGQSSGDFRLALSANQVGGSGGVRRGGALSALDFGDTERGALDVDNRFRLFWFQAQEGDQVSVRCALGVSMSAALFLYDSSFSQLASDPTGNEAQMEIGQTGIYFAALALSDPAAGGSYAVTLLGSAEAEETAGSDQPQAVSIGYGQRVHGSLDDERYSERYTFQAAANDQVLIHMEALEGNLDSFLYLYGPGGEIVGQDDDSGGGLDAELTATIPADGAYTITATRFGQEGGTSSGDYALTLNEGAASTLPISGGNTSSDGDDQEPVPENFAGLTQIRYGDRVNGTISPDDYFESYIFRANAGDSLITTLDRVNGDLDPMVLLLDANLNTLAQNDDASTGNLNSRLEFSIPADGYYALLATRFEGEEGTTAGDFLLQLEATSIAGGGNLLELLPTTALTSGASQRGRIGEGAPAVLYSFYATVGNAIEITLTADDPLGSQSALILADDDLREVEVSLDGFISHLVTQDGFYAILVSRQGGPLGDASGNFELALSGATGTPPEVVPEESEDAASNVLTYGGVITGEITGEDYELRYTFEGHAGDRVTVRMTALDATLDPVLILADAEGNELVRDDDGGGNLNALIDAELITETGTYTVIATRFEGEQGVSAGRFELALEAVPVSQPAESGGATGASSGQAFLLTPGVTVAGTISAESAATFYAFQGTAGTTVEVTMIASSGDLDPFLALLDSSQALVASDDDSGGNRNARLTYTLPADGLYYVVATRFEIIDGTTTGEYLLTLNGG